MYVYIYIYVMHIYIYSGSYIYSVSYIYSISFLSATLEKHWKVQFRQWFAKFNNVDSKPTDKKKYYLKMESTVDIHKKNTVNKTC